MLTSYELVVLVVILVIIVPILILLLLEKDFRGSQGRKEQGRTGIVLQQ